MESEGPYHVYLFSMFACYLFVCNETIRNKGFVPEGAAGVNTRISHNFY